MVPDGPAAEAGLLPDTVLPPGELHGHVGQCGVCPFVGAAGWGAGRAGTQRFPLQEGLNWTKTFCFVLFSLTLEHL